jgi:polynucleotide 5'-hydroxyl-kinase GRC3/NOL9
MKLSDIRPHAEWQQLDPVRMGATVLVIGATDAGKSTLVRWLAARAVAVQRPVAWIDADIGQTTLGVPTTMNLAMLEGPPEVLPPPAAVFFAGGTSPRGHMLPAVVGVERLRQRAMALGAAMTLIDTSGLISEAAGGGALKEWKIELLRPTTVIALQREQELQHLLGPLQRRQDLQLHVLPVSGEVQRRSPEARMSRRHRQYRDYFATAHPLILPLRGLPIYGRGKAAPRRLLSFLDRDGFSLALGLLLHQQGGRMEILTPLRETDGLAGLRFGDLRLDPRTGEEIQ